VYYAPLCPFALELGLGRRLVSVVRLAVNDPVFESLGLFVDVAEVAFNHVVATGHLIDEVLQQTELVIESPLIVSVLTHLRIGRLYEYVVSLKLYEGLLLAGQTHLDEGCEVTLHLKDA
jgi:hypothetical protein